MLIGLLSTVALLQFSAVSNVRAQSAAENKLDRLTADSTEKDTYIPSLKSGDDNLYIRLSGHVNKGVLVHDDGVSSLDYWGVDNGNSSTRARVEFFIGVDDYLAINGRIEGQWNPYSTGSVNQTNRGDYDWGTAQLRMAEVWIGDRDGVDMYGTLWLGQGSMASDGTSEVDLSGTDVIGYSGVADLSGGQLFRAAGTNTLSTVSVGNGFSNLDGLGRRLRVRYDSPEFAGFTVSTSYGKVVVPRTVGNPGWDLALRYGGGMNGAKYKAALAYSDNGSGTSRVTGSASILLPSMINFTVAAGHQDAASRDSVFYYGKAGYIASIVESGNTAVSIDAYFGDDFNSIGSTSRSYGFQLVQSLDYWKTDIYAGVRLYQFSEAAANYRDALGFLVGAKMRF